MSTFLGHVDPASTAVYLQITNGLLQAANHKFEQYSKILLRRQYMTKITLGSILYSFFEDYIKYQKGLSSTSIKSYSDTIRLFLSFISNKTNSKITKL